MAGKKEIQELADAQTAEIMRLLFMIKTQEEEIKHLKSLLTSCDGLVVASRGLSNEELICLKQIEVLRAKSEAEELTYEEGRKLDVYVKLLKIIRCKEADDKSWMAKVDTDALYKAVKDADGGH